ncbi:hypothetical protein L6R29_10170 [Myxococcota bacterium]|nr:hypothetical protein [Myxococcota bacterium]
MAKYKAARPSAPRFSLPINGPMIGLLLVLAVGGYFVYAYVPPWVKSLNAKSKVKDILGELSLRDVQEDSLAETVSREMTKMGVEVSQADVRVEVNRDSRIVRVWFDWNTDISFPFIEKKHRVKYGFDIERKMQ